MKLLTGKNETPVEVNPAFTIRAKVVCLSADYAMLQMLIITVHVTVRSTPSLVMILLFCVYICFRLYAAEVI